MCQKSINISLTKIMNYSEESGNFHIYIGFYCKKTSTLITKKSIKGICVNNCLDFSMNLKINFTQKQNQIIIIVEEEDQLYIQNIKYIGEVQISLLELSKKRLKYYTLQKTDKILQIEINQQIIAKKSCIEGLNKQKLIEIRNRQQFIEERKKFLTKTIETEKLLRKTFHQRIFSLTQDSKSIKLNTITGKNSIQLQKNLIQQNLLEDIDFQSSTKIKKCRSNQALMNYDFGQKIINGIKQKKEMIPLNPLLKEQVQRFRFIQDY